MMKCPMPACCVVIAPEKGTTDLGQQKGALVRHLTGGDEAKWHGCSGHSLDLKLAKEIAEQAEVLALAVEKAL